MHSFSVLGCFIAQPKSWRLKNTWEYLKNEAINANHGLSFTLELHSLCKF